MPNIAMSFFGVWGSSLLVVWQLLAFGALVVLVFWGSNLFGILATFGIWYWYAYNILLISMRVVTQG